MEVADPVPTAAWWCRAHRALMPDYNRKAAVYWWAAVVLGLAVLVEAVRSVSALPQAQALSLAAGISVTMFAALFPLRIPRSKNSFAAGEIFIFLLLLLHGPAAAALAAVGEALVATWRTSKRWTSRIVSPAMAGMAMFATGSLFNGVMASLRDAGLANAGVLLLATMGMAVLYFVVNTVLMTAIPHLKSSQWPRPREMFGNFGWVGLVVAVSATVACLLYLSVEQSGGGVLLGALPTVALLLAGLHVLFRQQEQDAAVHQSRIEAAQREAKLAARHALELEVREQRFQHMAFHDSLTGLPNRRRFQEQLAQALARARGDARRQFCLMFLDFDRFKFINDSLGHAVGDAFLVAAARRIQQLVRPHDIVARLGGDEFAVIAEALDSGRHAVSLAERLLEALRQPIAVGSTEIVSSASIGITFSSMGYTAPEDMLRDADTAMYKAKAGGRSSYALFDAVLHTEVAQRLRLEGDLRRALGSAQMTVVYQPMFDLATRSIVGFEALARWQHPEFGTIGPGQFIPVAEDSGLIVDLTDLVLRAACTELGRWQQHRPSGPRLTMHVNVSGHDIGRAGLVPRVQAALAAANLQPQDLALELTETILAERLEAALPTLLELRNLGVGLSVDDFGTGYSSLQHLASLPVNGLKVDRVFVAGLERGDNSAAVIQAIMLLGQSLGKTIIAEGIETEPQAALLRSMGCQTGQGYFFARPMTPAGIDELLGQAGGAVSPPTQESALAPA